MCGTNKLYNMRLSEKEQENRVSLNADVMLRRALDLRDNNKLIAEFMDLRSTGLSIYKESDYKYHKSWDWLMPVIEKIATHTLSSTIEMLAEYYYKDGDNQDGLEGIEEFYKAVVFWIEENKSIPLDKFEKEIEEIERIEKDNN